MKINVCKNDICYTCKYGKQAECPATENDVFRDDVGYMCDCNRYEKKEDKPKAKRFVKPTVDEIRAYVREKRYTHTDPQAFYDYYESVDWRVGKNKMTKWKSAVSSWENRQKSWDEEKRKKENKGRLQRKPSYDLEAYKRYAMYNTEI